MDKSVELLFRKIAEDEDFGKEILQQEEAEKIIEIAEKKGIKLTEKNISEVSAILNDNENEYQEIEIFDDNLEAVSGGRRLFEPANSLIRGVEIAIKIVRVINSSEKENSYLTNDRKNNG